MHRFFHLLWTNGHKFEHERTTDLKELHVHFHHSPSKENLDYLKTLIDENISISLESEVEIANDFQILISGHPTRELLQKSPALEAVIIPWAGLSKETRELLGDFPNLRVHNLHHNASATAEFAFALLLAAAKHLLPIDRKFRHHDWTPRYKPNPSILLEGKQVLILGYGEIGQRVGRMCAGLGMKIHAIRRSIDEMEIDGEIKIYPIRMLRNLLVNANVLFLTLPATQETHEMIGEKELNALPEGAILINVARGEIIEEKAMFEYLSNNKKASAGLDVWYQYPEKEEDWAKTPPSIYPFHQLENVVMSPHRAGLWDEWEKVSMEYLAELLNCAARNKSMENLVDLQNGY
jgi:phosphoglycerate dehydrogenase-like enzyme